MQFLGSDEAVTLPLKDVLCRLDANVEAGLSTSEVARRVAFHGDNVLVVGAEEPLWRKFLDKFKEPMILLLLSSAFISLLLQQFDDAISIAMVRAAGVAL
jgi:Ca2+-transporting ATPase